MTDFFKSPKVQKFSALGLLLLILLAIPFTLSQVGQNQTVSQNASWAVPQEQHYACGGNLTVLMDTAPENPVCTSGSISDGSLKSFQSTVILKASSGSVGAYTVHWKWDSFWCPHEDPHAPCLSPIGSTGEQTGGLTGNGSAFVSATSKALPANPQACGYFQNDFGFYVVSNDNPSQVLCGASLSNLGTTNNNASWCHTNTSCTAPSDTPTPGITVTDTPTPGITVTDTPTPSDTPTPGLTITPTDTPNPSNTPTDTPNPSDTPTPVIVTTTPKPTLPPTGPGNTFVSIGAIGLAIALGGLALSLGF